MTPTVPEEQEQEQDTVQAALLLQKTLRGRAVQLRMAKGRARKTDLIAEMRLENPLTEEEEAVVADKVQKASRQASRGAAREEKEGFINSFLERLEGETLGRMLDYLSSELAHSAVSPQARDMLEGGAEEHRAKEQDHIFSEIVKVTQSTVDQYLDAILLRTIYTSAHEDSLASLGVDKDKVIKNNKFEYCSFRCRPCAPHRGWPPLIVGLPLGP